MRHVLLAAAVCLATPSAAADLIEGVYLQTEELCAQAKSDSLQTVIEAGNVMLTERGLESIEYNCEFVRIVKATRAPAWFVDAICQEPGHLFPDVLSVTQMNDAQIDIVSVRADDPEAGGGNGGSYFLCDGVAMP